MDRHADESATLELRADFLDAAMRWRDLARRALKHEQLASLKALIPAIPLPNKE